MLNVDALVIDSEDRIGDNWRRRYHQLVLHDPVWYDHMPYLSFPSSWPVFTPKDKLAEFFESYAKLLELNVWTRTTVASSSWDESKKQWTITLKRQMEDGGTTTRTLYPRHIIQATGHSGEKKFPAIKGIENFKGKRTCHSSEFSGARPVSKAKTAVVVRSYNSGHDIAQDFYKRGYNVTIVQYSSACIVLSESVTEIGLKRLYSENSLLIEDADLLVWGILSELFKVQQIKVTALQNYHDAKILDGLKKAGFNLDTSPNNTSIYLKYF